MENILRKLTESNFSDLAGLIINASIPLSEGLINEVIADALLGNKNISSLRISIFSQNRISADLKTVVWPWPINLKLQVESPRDFADSPKIKTRLENHGLLGKLGAALNALPNGIQMNDDQLIIDIAAFLTTPQQRQLLDLIQSLEITTKSGEIILDVKIRVKE